MRILLVNKFHYLRGGSETYYLGLGTALKAAGHTVGWFSMEHPENMAPDGPAWFVPNVDYNTKNSPLVTLQHAGALLYSRQAAALFRQAVLKFRPDVVHLHNVHRQITLSVVDVCKAFNLPVVATLHDYIYLCPAYLMLSHGQPCQRCLGGHFRHCVTRRCIKDSVGKSLLAAIEAQNYRWRKTYDAIDTFIAPSGYMRQKMLEGGFSAQQLTCLPNFLGDEWFADESGNTSRQPVLLYVGRLSEEKGVDVLLRAFASASLPMTLCLAGEGDAQPQLQALCTELGLGERVHFAGRLAPEELRTLYRSSTGLVLPSQSPENAPYAVIEAQAMGLPAVVSRAGGLPELITEGETGFLFETGSVADLSKKLQILAFLDPLMYNDMTLLSIKCAQTRYGKTSHVEKLVALYQDTAERKGLPLWPDESFPEPSS